MNSFVHAAVYSFQNSEDKGLMEKIHSAPLAMNKPVWKLDRSKDECIKNTFHISSRDGFQPRMTQHNGKRDRMYLKPDKDHILGGLFF